MASADGHFLYDDDFHAVITILGYNLMTVNASEVVKKQLMKKIITNATCTLWFPYSDSIFRKH